MKLLLLFGAILLWAQPARAQNAPQLVPCATVSPQAVETVPAPFNADMQLVCYDTSGHAYQGLVPPNGTHWVDGNIDVGLSAIDDRSDPNGQPRYTPGWYVSLTPREIPPSMEVKLRQILAKAVLPAFIDGAQIIELETLTSTGEIKQEFWITPADPVATHGIKLLMECHHFCQGSDKPWILGVVPNGSS